MCNTYCTVHIGDFAGSTEGRLGRQILARAGQFDGTETERDGTTMLTPRCCLFCLLHGRYYRTTLALQIGICFPGLHEKQRGHYHPVRVVVPGITNYYFIPQGYALYAKIILQ